MDILTLGKMNQMSKDLNTTMEYLANSTFEALNDICGTQTEIVSTQSGSVACLEDTTQTGIDALVAAGGGGNGTQEVYFFNENAKGCHCFNGCADTWTVPNGTKSITFEAWGGGGAGAGHCCQGCWCDIASCGSQGGVYARKTICEGQGDFAEGDVYNLCVGNGANANGGGGCWQGCCWQIRGCASYLTGNGLSNFCAPGGAGGYNLYCTCRCNANHCWYETPQCLGLCMGQNVDFAATATGNQFYKMRHNCDCGSRYTQTGSSYGLRNDIMQHIEDSMSWCGCETNCQAYRFAGGGMNMQKSYCGNALCGGCVGSPGHSGLIKISYS
jgi:hypothetical protein